MRSASFVFAVLAAAVLSGCGDVPRARVHGTVKFQGQPLTHTTLIFIASDNKTHLVALKADGSYEVSGVARGPVKVSLQQDLPKVTPREDPATFYASKAAVKDEKTNYPRPKSSAPPTSDPEEPLPAIYKDPEKSGLTFDLKEPDQEWSIDLK